MSNISNFVGAQSARISVEAAIKKAKDNDNYHALLSLTEDRALERADMVDRGEITGKLAGVPFIVKDNFLAFGAPTTAASKMLEDFQAPLQATAVEKLEAEGAICIGKANLDAFAHGGSTENSAFGVTKNAIDQTRVAGGSSGGSAVVAALDIVPFALGTDTGGSIRQPASFNGVYGMKPTYGTVSRYGVVAMASSTDTIGCFATSAEDVALVLGIMAGSDDKDMTTLPDFFAENTQVKPGQKIGLIKEFMTDDVDSVVRERTTQYVAELTAAGHTVEEVSLPMLRYTLAMYYIIVPAEISSNLARYDGVRYGYRAEGVSTLAELYGKSRDEGFMTENKRRIMIGSYVLSSGFFDAYYQQAQKARTLLIEQFNELFQTYDALVGPVSPTPAFGIGENTSDPVKMYLADVMTVPASLAGLPALSAPAGTDEAGLPIGVQLIGRQRSDAQLLALAASVEVN
ncbi:TPA: Asp-tRNA(Asn)/Glu-tRNA(Gln) amidotransferase subunit GatA [Candidatus Saccharibacteria bacterium]|nr:MAG: glutamyl-tRNA(Gln) amidotransferase (subunit A) [Candidatus Saccharibacteria bacterium GW2011_GWC2_44_17]OGL33242.1 MAG: glutaminyl-tRNA synthase (glutamine-hydrolyzing) subunit A [Candidatus Saccharibacteria bacterium RIFCSPHIGHO2_12_FULL_47_16]HBH77556.1 Asp-tRNA(Asn)/Glu-tRNA(Gln) amidotransferase subunit GatA [Candidatus Saccharibacteria bacterium]